MDVQTENPILTSPLCQNCGRPIVPPDSPVVAANLGYYHEACARSPHKQRQMECPRCNKPFVPWDRLVATKLGVYHEACAGLTCTPQARLTKCGECAFWKYQGLKLDPHNQIEKLDPYGACHRHPPSGLREWPVTREHDFCGDGASKPQTELSKEEKTDG